MADTGNDRVRKISTDGIVSTVAAKGAPSQGGGAEESLGGVAAVYCASDGSVYAAAGSSVTKISPEGAVSPVARLEPAKDRFPDMWTVHLVGITGDSAGHLYVVDRMGYRVSRITPDGKVETFLDAPKSPRSALVAGETLFVAEDRRILAIDLPGGTMEVFFECSEDAYPCLSDLLGGMMLDDQGNVLVTDSYGGLFRVFAAGDRAELVIDFGAGIEGVCRGPGGDWFFVSAQDGGVFRAPRR